VVVLVLAGCGSSALSQHSQNAKVKRAVVGARGCGEPLFAPTRSVLRAAGATPARFEVFRRAGSPNDRLPSTKGLAIALEQDLESYDPSLIRAVDAQPLAAPFGTKVKYRGYMIIGQGAGAELSLSNYPCTRELSVRKRRAFERALTLELALS
jgi:hypothetical protein